MHCQTPATPALDPAPPTRRARMRHGVAAALTWCLATATALAVQPAQWIHTTEADFEEGEREGVVVTNLGDLKLARDVEPLGDLPEGVSIVFDLARYGGETYVAAGPQGVLLRVTDDGFETLAEFPGEQVFCLDATPAGLLVGVSGENSRVLAIGADGEPREAIRLENVRYVWDLLHAGRDVMIATGTDGELLRAPWRPEGEAVEGDAIGTVLETGQANVLCLARGPDGAIYAGTDTKGLVYRVTYDERGRVEPYVLLDADEPEIGSIVVLEDGTVYAGTADANQARPGRLEEAATEEQGRPDAAAEGGAEEGDGEVDMPDSVPETPPSPEPVQPEGEPTATDPDAAPVGDAADADSPSADDASGAAEGGDEAEAEASAPTPEQYDRMREMVRARLEAAREGQDMQVSLPGGGAARATGAATGGTRVRPPSSASSNKPGNAVYRIDPEGFVTEVFRESVMVLRLVDTDAGLIAATGNQGQVFRIDPTTDETVVLSDLEVEQVPAVLPIEAGGALLGTANPGQLLRLSEGRADRGLYTSRVLDAGQVSLWGTLRVTAAVPPATRVELETRSGNVGDPEHPAWSSWRDAGVLADPDHPPLQPREAQIESPPARFFQYRLRLMAGDDAEPVIDRVEANYVVPNLAPSVTAVTAERDEFDIDSDDAPPTEVELSWEASDPNGDRLLYDLHFRPQGSERFLELTEDLENAKHAWQTRRVPDGWYVVRVIARDARDNTPDATRSATRLSDPILVDHTAPALDVTAVPLGDGRVRLSGRATDERATIASIAYIANDDDRYTPILPEDLILDSTSEPFEVTVRGFAPGPHVVTVRAVDAQGNTVYRALNLDIDD